MPLNYINYERHVDNYTAHCHSKFKKCMRHLKYDIWEKVKGFFTSNTYYNSKQLLKHLHENVKNKHY